ncbi:hypothetical protein SBRCBS47491_004543 [Sporothrix bragantina]|uniref:Uncharacterized protein n=1 Tax=Sporothrix bragantina TaxID=671064 RepID=A0ABP0BPW8_9PEZI
MATTATTTTKTTTQMRPGEQASPAIRETLGDASSFLTPNGAPTLLESVNNPNSWPADHRRIPPYRAAVRNPEWDRVGGQNVSMRLFMWTMLSGCQLLQWGYAVPTALGLHKRGLMMYKVANTW